MVLTSIHDHALLLLLTFPGPQTHSVLHIDSAHLISISSVFCLSHYSVWHLGAVSDDQEALLLLFDSSLVLLKHPSIIICLYNPHPTTTPRDK